MDQRLALLIPLLFFLIGYFEQVECAGKFLCYKCSALLEPNSTCLIGGMKETEECTADCFVAVYTAAGLRIRVTRGCSEDKCRPFDACKLKSRTGKCKSCCQGHYCNSELPDVDGGVVVKCCNENMILGVSFLVMLFIFDLR